MDSKAKIGLGVAGAVVAIGAAVGVGTYTASLVGSGQAAAQPSGYGQDAQGRGGRPGQGLGGLDRTEMAAQLATKLGVDQAEVEAALREVLTADRPSGTPSALPSGTPSAPPQGGPDASRGAGGLESMAAGLAQKLGLDQAKVLAALQEVMGSRGAAQPSAAPTSR